MGQWPRRAANREWKQPMRKKCGVVKKKLKVTGELKSALTSAMEMQSMEFAQLVFSLVLIQYFLTVLLFGMVMYILCHYMLEVCNFLFWFLQGIDCMMIALILEETLKFKLLNIDYVDFWSWYERILHYDFVKSLLEPESGMWLFECNLSPKLIKKVTIRRHGFVGVGTPLLKSVFHLWIDAEVSYVPDTA